MRAPGGGNEPARQEPTQLSADVGDRVGGGRLGGTRCTSLAAANTFSTRPRISIVNGNSASATRTRNATNSARVYTGSGASASVAASAQSSSSAGSEPSGLAPSARRVRGSSCRSTALTGDVTPSRTNRRVPGRIARSCSADVAKTRRSTAPPASTNAGKPRTGRPPTVRWTTRAARPVLRASRANLSAPVHRPPRERQRPEPASTAAPAER
jgi:hypothetical protein